MEREAWFIATLTKGQRYARFVEGFYTWHAASDRARDLVAAGSPTGSGNDDYGTWLLSTSEPWVSVGYTPLAPCPCTHGCNENVGGTFKRLVGVKRNGVLMAATNNPL